MPIASQTLSNAAIRLHSYLLKTHWNGHALAGPDSGIRFNARIGRFIKSYTGWLPWHDEYTYMQAQGYWILSNWLMSDTANNSQSAELATACSEYVLQRQCPAGYWEYPNPEWKGRIATVEGCFAALGLVESYARTGEEAFLAGAKKWHRFMVEETGFQGSDEALAVNYFSNVSGGMVPNNTTLALMMLARLSEVTKDERYLEQGRGMVKFLERVQLLSGELPYSVVSLSEEGRPHFLCFQYNAFEFMDLVQYHRVTGDEAVWRVMEKLACYLSTGLSEAGFTRYNCQHEHPLVLYYTCALGEALSQATRLGLGDYGGIADRAFEKVLSFQRKDGGLAFFSRANYGILADRRSYPRNLSMMLYHLLLEARTLSAIA